MLWSRTRIAEGLLVVAAIGLRGGAAWSIGQTGHARHPLVDAHTYWAQAMSLADGRNPFAEGFYQPPGYPMLLSWIQQLGGTSLWEPRFLQLGLGVLTTMMLIGLGRRLGGPDRPWFGVLAGAIYTLYPSTLLFELDLLTPSVTSFLTVILLFLVTPGAPYWRLGLAGCLAGLSSAVHPSFLIVSMAIAAVAWFHSGNRLTAVAWAMMGLFVGLIPITQANIDQFGQLRVTSNNAGINFYMGNNPDWKRTAFLRPGLEFRQLALEAEPHRRDGFERNDYWMSRAVSGIAAEPHRWLKTLTTKTIWSINDTEIPRNEDYRCRTRDGPLSWMGFRLIRYGFIFPLAMLGAMMVWRRRPEVHFPVLAWAALHVPVVLFVVGDRYRMATWPMMCLMAPFGLQAIRSVRAWGWARRLGVVLVFTLPWLPIDPITERDDSWCAHVEGNLAYMDGDMESAESHYRRAVEMNSGDWSAHSWLAQTLSRRGEVSQAIQHLDIILADFPDSFPTLRTAANLRARAGDYAGGAELMLRAYAVPGERTNTGMKAVQMLLRSGQKDRARQLLADDPKLAQRWNRSR